MKEAEALLDWVNGRAVVALSPHPDDLALSVGGILQLLIQYSRITAVTCFNLSCWAPYSDTRNKDVETISLIRKAEEVAFWKRLGMDGCFLDFEDAGLRGYGEEDERSAKHSDDPLWPVFRERFESMLKEIHGDLILCPLSIGNHIDHLMVRESFMECNHSLAHSIFYEDLPYAAEVSDSDSLEVIVDLLKTPRSIVFPIDDQFEKKLSYLACYSSQVGKKEKESVSYQATRVMADRSRGERLWVSDAFCL